MVELGDRVEDPVTGFKGIAVCRHSYLNGCDRISVLPRIDDAGKIQDEASFDEPQLRVITKREVPVGDKKTGGPERHMPKDKPVHGSKK